MLDKCLLQEWAIRASEMEESDKPKRITEDEAGLNRVVQPGRDLALN